MAYENHASIHKEESRKLILSLVKNKNTNVFTLPSINFSLEKRLLNKGNVKLTCAEHSFDTFKLQKFILIASYEERIDLKYGDAFDILNNSESTYDVIWIDLCTGLQSSTINKFLSLIQTININKTCHISITYACKREYYAKSIVEAYNAKDMTDFRNNIFPELVINFAHSANRECTVVHNQSYKEPGSKYNMPMKMLTFKLKQK